MEFHGTLFTYYEPDRLTAFECGPTDSKKTLVYVGGLADGYNSVPFLAPLQRALEEEGWSLVQVQLSSSYTGYGIVNLQKDCDELDHLIEFLKTRRDKSKIVVLGHSTGSQDCYWHNKYGKMNKSVDAYILQAPVSDREHMKDVEPRYEEYLKLSQDMRAAGKGQEIMPRSAAPIPTTADRFYSLAAFGGDDDVFSTDLPDDMIKKLYTGLERPMAFLHAKDDECLVKGNPDPGDVVRRYQTFCPAIKKIGVLESGGHCVTTEEGQSGLCKFVIDFIRDDFT